MTRSNLTRGYLIAFEGIDGSGKSTQLRLLADWLRERRIPVKCLEQPSSSLAGRILRSRAKQGQRLAPHVELALFIRDRREQARCDIRPLLSKHFIVLLDRHYLSSVAYQGSAGIDPDDILRTCLSFCPIPDVTILVDIDPTVAVQRISRQRAADAFEHVEYLETVRQLYLNYAGRLSNIHTLNGESSSGDLAARIRALVAKVLGIVM